MIHARISALVLLCAVGTGFAGAAAGQAQRPINSYIVQVAEGFEPGQVGRAVAQRTGGGLGHVYTRALRGFSIQLPPGLARQALEGETGVLKVEIDLPTHAVAQTVPTGVRRIAADQYALAHPGGVNVDIAILDTGIDVDHPDLNVVGGTHFYTVLLLGIFPVGYQDNNYDDNNGHGTHCAGIAAALDNEDGVVGVAPGARLWAVKVLDAGGSGYVSDLIAGIDWVAANSNIRVASMSLAATGRVDQLRTAIQNCVNQGVVFVAAAGNEHKDIYGADGVFPSADDTIPAAYPEVAAISALADSDGTPGGTGTGTSYGPDDSFATFSNYSRTVVAGNPVTSPGRAIDLLMPGVGIYSCWMGGGYYTASGTSMATPHAAGLAALYIAEHGAASNASGVRDIRQALIDGGKDQASGMRLANTNVGTEPDGAPENLGWAGPAQTEPVTDIAITSVSAPSMAVRGDTVDIDVVVRNVGNQNVGGFEVILEDATSHVTIGNRTVAGLSPGASESLTFSWDTAGVNLGGHALTASHNLEDGTPGNNSATASIEIKAAVTDIAITSIEAPPSAVLGSTVNIAVTVSNTGNQSVSEDIPVTVTVDNETVPIGERTISGGLAAGASTTLTFAWNTTGASVGSHTLMASHDLADDEGANNTRSATVQITEQSTRPVVYVTTDVGPWITLRRDRWKAEATVIVLDDRGLPVLYTTITGRWTGVYQATVTGSTDNSGLELFVTKALTTPGTVTFEVTGILDSEGRECELRGTLSDSYTKP